MYYSAPSSSDEFADLLECLRRQVDARLAELVPQPDDGHDLLGAALHEGVLAPGKRMRPLLVLLVGRSLGHRSRALLELACAVELVHAASLFLDDMPCMDNARLRRGRLAVHARYGEDVAMLGAVALLAQACAMVAGAPGLSGELRAQLAGVLCHAVGMQGLVRGQYRDLREGRAARLAEDIASTNQQKTGSLFSAGFEMAALAAGADEQVRLALRQAASALGHAFQLRDDLEDGAQTPATFGKDRHKDVGKSTLVALLGREAVAQCLAGHLAQAETQLRLALPADAGVALLVRKAFAMPSMPRQQAANAAGESYRGLASRGLGA
ncbi:MAG: Farnesyltranstransferase (Geranylgeranyl-diphosphate synthase)-like protein [Polaromonas sp.]|nr:Farnesyltranstransferase (Geranylgeranyl-diphosphate synthase)-like protein [Polaromonas sp.]